MWYAFIGSSYVVLRRADKEDEGGRNPVLGSGGHVTAEPVCRTSDVDAIYLRLSRTAAAIEALRTSFAPLAYTQSLLLRGLFSSTAIMLSSRVARAGLRASVQQFSSAPRTAALNGIRTYATPAQDVKPPVAVYGIDGTYANALVCDALCSQCH